ncbi:RNA polymerase sigma-70 factor [Snuella lapsa]|uniref:RNA polymerase sigma-70 factor n=1 Tax=Snuella lapsa TaxID=870481 RepID=A0ABP6YHW7_9FLAO
MRDVNFSNINSLLSLIKNEDKFAYRVLYNVYYPKLLHIAKSYVANKEDAEEIVQDVFVKIWHKKDAIDINTNINGYIYQITRNACIDFLRAAKNRLSLEGNIEQLEAALNFHVLSDDSASNILEEELKLQILNAIDSLPDKCKHIFIKSRMEGLKNVEISEELKISKKTVEGHISKAIKHLRIHLKHYFFFF